MAVTATSFRLLPIDLIDAAIAFSDSMNDQGFRISVEPSDLEYPDTPTFLCKRHNTMHFVEVASKLNLISAESWANFGKASKNDTRYSIVLSSSKGIAPNVLTKLKDLGVGVCIFSDERITEIANAHDLSLNFSFPPLSRKLKPKLGNAQRLLAQGNWMEAYEDACVTFETEARTYLSRAVRMGRVSFVTSNGRAVQYSEASVNKMTLGQLGRAYSDLTNPTQLESRVSQTISRINDNRITAAHYKKVRGKRMTQLRDQAGKDLIVIVNTMGLLCG